MTIIMLPGAGILWPLKLITCLVGSGLARIHWYRYSSVRLWRRLSRLIVLCSAGGFVVLGSWYGFDSTVLETMEAWFEKLWVDDIYIRCLLLSGVARWS